MGRKDIISDFSALKGKVTFSDKPAYTIQPVHEAEVKKGNASKTDNILKVGQKVVLMDSDLRGTIVSIGRKVGIELEDGLMVQAAYGEFALTHEGEISALRQSKVKVKKTHNSSNASATASFGTLSVDLHIEAIPGGRSVPKGQQLQFQMDFFRKVIREHLPHKGMKINFIHGIGDGILKSAIRKELDEVLAIRCSYLVGDPAVTIVTIR